MEAILPLILVATVLVGGLCAFFLVVVQPIWGMVDVAVSDKHSGATKAIVIVLTLVLLGPVMTFFYACFGTRSSALRRMTLLAFAMLLATVICALGLAIGVPAARIFWPRTISSATTGRTAANDAAKAVAASSAAFDPFPADDITPFQALHVLSKEPGEWSIALAEFTGRGPRVQSLIAVTAPSGPYPVTHLAIDPSGPVYYAITTHEVGKIVPNTGQFVELALDPAVGKPSWPSAIAFDSKQGLLLIVARSQGYSYRPATGEWQKIPGLKDDDIIALAYEPEENVLYGLRSRPGGELATSLIRLTSNGAVLERVELSRPIPVGQYPFCLAQLCWSGNQLVVLVSPGERSHQDQASMYVVDAKSGACRVVKE